MQMSSRPSRAPWLPILTATVLLQTALSAQDIGHQGPSLAGCGPSIGNPSPTETKSQSKLWFQGASWWGSLWSAGAQAFRIHRLDAATHTWIDTGVPVESRPDSHSDALRVGSKLYLATHEFAQGAGSPGDPILLLRYSFANGAYTLDPGFPVTIGNSSTESLVIERDSTGTLWAVWMQGLRVHVAHSLGSDTLWSAPAILPGCTSNTTSDDICGLIHFGGDRIGVLWSDENQMVFSFAVHVDGDPAASWQPVEIALSGESDDHLNLKSDASGKVYAVIKNQHDEIKLLARNGGVWSQHLVADSSANFTRPILLVDEVAGQARVFAGRGGVIRTKVAPLATLVFPSGTGTAVIRDDDGTLVNPTSTKQDVHSETGLVVLAANPTTSGNYWHHEVPRVPRAGTLSLAPPAPSRGGAINLPLVASGATPGAAVVFFASLPSASLPSASGVSPASRLLGLARADEHGVATLAVRLPLGSFGPPVYGVIEPATRRVALR